MIGKSLVVPFGLAALLTAGACSKTDVGEVGSRKIYDVKQTSTCRDHIADYLVSLKIGVDDMTSLNVYEVKSTVGRLLGYNAWVSMRSCQGSLVMNLSPTCRVVDSYTRGECRLKDLKQP